MVEFITVKDNKEDDLLSQVLKNILEKCQPRFKNKLEIWYKDIDGADWIPGVEPISYIIEAYTSYRFGFIPQKKWRCVCGIAVTSMHREVDCRVFNPLVADIVKEEVIKYAEKMQVKTVYFMEKDDVMFAKL